MGFIKNMFIKIVQNQNAIMEQNREIKKLLVDVESAAKARKYDEQRPLIRALKISLDSICPDPQEAMNGILHVNYRIPVQDIKFDLASGKLDSVPEEFKAINELGLLTISDSNAISDAIEAEKEKITKRNAPSE